MILEDTETILLIKYFSLFRHPLTLEEIYRFSSAACAKERLYKELEELVSLGVLQCVDGFYIYNNDASCIEKRLKGEAKAALLLPEARKAGKLVAKFPFVKFVGISGSLSKNYADDKTDFDFFIITANNTLWICRTILHVFKKLSFLVGKQHSFCMNYFIDENHMEIEEKNIFTRIELSTLIPLNNKRLYQHLLLANENNLTNITHLLPEYADIKPQLKSDSHEPKEKNSWLKPLNIFFMKLTDAKWKRKWKKNNYPMEDYTLAFKTTPFVSKNHPKNYQKNILNKLQEQSK